MFYFFLCCFVFVIGSYPRFYGRCCTQSFADRVLSYFVPTIVCLSVLTLVVWLVRFQSCLLACFRFQQLHVRIYVIRATVTTTTTTVITTPTLSCQVLVHSSPWYACQGLTFGNVIPDGSGCPINNDTNSRYLQFIFPKNNATITACTPAQKQKRFSQLPCLCAQCNDCQESC